MTEQDEHSREQMKNRGKGTRPIGGIGQYATIGGGSKHSASGQEPSPAIALPHEEEIAESRERASAESHNRTSTPLHSREIAPVRTKRGYALRDDLVKAAKRLALEEDRHLYEIMEEALEEYLARKRISAQS